MFTSIEAVTQTCFSRKVFYEYFASLLEKIHEKNNVSNVNFIEIILLHEHSHVNVLHFCSRTPFLENTSGELLLLYIVLNIKFTNVEVLSKLPKNFQIQFNIINTLSNFVRDFSLLVKG